MPILPITHSPGVHCASTALRDLAAFHGLDWSEALCFGLGAGLGIWYLALPGVSPSRMVHVRSEDIEAQFFTRIGLDFAWSEYDDPADSHLALITVLDAGRPALIQTDIFHLPSNWPALDDSPWCARFAYQVIEKRGTGGGGFRTLYAAFLAEAGAWWPELAAAAHCMTDLATAWSQLATACHSASEGSLEDLSALADALERVATREADYHRWIIAWGG